MNAANISIVSTPPFTRIRNKIFSIFFDLGTTNFSQPTGISRLRTTRRIFKNPFFIPMGIVFVIIILVGFFAVKGLNSNSPSKTSGKISIEPAKASQVLNKQFVFPLKDNAGKEVSKLKFIVENAEIKDEIIVKGKRATSVKGRTFLIVNIKVTNDFTQSVEINVRNYVRLIAGKSNERLAPDIHNDPVEIQALSTKYTRVGFPINDNMKDLTLQVGELTGKKELIALQLK